MRIKKKIWLIVPIIVFGHACQSFLYFAASPTVETFEAPPEYITETGAMLVGYVSDDGGEEIIDKGFQFGFNYQLWRNYIGGDVEDKYIRIGNLGEEPLHISRFWPLLQLAKGVLESWGCRNRLVWEYFLFQKIRLIVFKSLIHLVILLRC